MKSLLLLLFMLFSLGLLAQKNKAQATNNTHLTFLGKTRPLTDYQNDTSTSRAKSHGEMVDISNPLLPSETGFTKDGIAQRRHGTRNSVVLLQNFEGIHNVNNNTVPDTEGDVGLNYYFQMINRSFAIFDKQGNKLFGPLNNKTIFSDFSGPWDDMFFTDPIVMYDHIADRWIVSNMAFNWGVDYYEMIAVSATSNPVGAWFCYAVQFENMPDYPKFGVWTDGYYLSVNEWEITSSGNATFVGPTVMAFNREDMISGNSNPRTLEFHVPVSTTSITQEIASFQPSDLDGTAPPNDTPNYFICIKDDEWGYPEDRIWIWEFHSDWDNPTNSSFTELEVLFPAPFSSNYNNMDYIPQLGTTTTLQSLCHFTMYRLQYMVFDDYEVLMCNHTVEVDGDNHAGVRWYEMRKENDSWEIFQQGTYAPDDACRWMGGVAMDKDGNIGMGYSVSSEDLYPSIRVTGRNQFDTPGEMSFGESEVIAGGGSQESNQRWGDYSMMALDPADGVTFWYTQEYMPISGYNDFDTRIASFQLHRNLSFSTDTLKFTTVEECLEGKSLAIRNNSQYDIIINEFENEGFCGDATWNIDPWNITLPVTLSAGDSIVCIVKVDLPVTNLAGPITTDSLTLVTDYNENSTIISIDEWLISEISVNSDRNHNLIEVVVYPNPTNGETAISYELKDDAVLTLEIIDQQQNIVKKIISNQRITKGMHSIIWNLKDANNSDIPPGIYFYRFTMLKDVITGKIVVG